MLKNIQCADWKKYRIYGFTVWSDFPFANRLSLVDASFDEGGCGSVDATADLTFTCAEQPPFEIDRDQMSPSYASPLRTNDRRSVMTLYRTPLCDVLHFPGLADFYVSGDAIVCHLTDEYHAKHVEIRLLGPVLSFWMENRGIPALHASAVVVEGKAVAFLSSNKGGKSAIAATFMRSGYPLLSDDILPLEMREMAYWGRPGYPTMRMWPDEADHFLGHHENLERVHQALSKRRVPVGQSGFGTFCEASFPLSHIYLPERKEPSELDTPVKILPVSYGVALMSLVRNSFSAGMVEEIGMAPHRFEFFTQMLLKVQVRRLLYPAGFEYLPTVSRAVTENIDTS